jgi:hypothetical protein
VGVESGEGLNGGVSGVRDTRVGKEQGTGSGRLVKIFSIITS